MLGTGNRFLMLAQKLLYADLLPETDTCPPLPLFKGGHFELRSLTWVSLWAIVVSKPIFWTAQRNQASEWAPNSIQVLGRDLISMARRVQVSAKPLPTFPLDGTAISHLKAFIT